tara:strand:+ start:730 stop:1314 length:585 start_codon:yes stop_codon:yes gene_type:complete
MDNKLPLFYCDLFIQENVGTEEQREDLKNQILQAKKENRGYAAGGNPGCWRSNTTYDMTWLYDAMRKLTTEANRHYFEQDENVFKMLLDKCTNIDYNIWTNVNEVGSSNALHTHTPDAWAGIYYVQAEGTGNLVFYNPANTLVQCNQHSPYTRRTGITPKDGMLVLWPGWVPHSVEENKSNQQRINLAWGINFN